MLVNVEPLLLLLLLLSLSLSLSHTHTHTHTHTRTQSHLHDENDTMVNNIVLLGKHRHYAHFMILTF